MVMNKKSFNVDVAEELSDLFSVQIGQRGYAKYRAIEAALRAFMALPAAVQVQLMNIETKDVYTLLVNGLVNAEVTRSLASLSSGQKALILEAVKSIKLKGSGKHKFSSEPI